MANTCMWKALIYAKHLIDEGAIGSVVQVLGLGPHRLNAASRPDWFFIKEKYGGILCDIGSHQIYQFLIFADVQDAKVVYSQIGNFNTPDHPELDDFGDATLTASSGETMYFRVDWFTPDGLSTWGDGRTLILGTEGYIELRKYTDIGIAQREGNVYLVNQSGERYINVQGKVWISVFRTTDSGLYQPYRKCNDPAPGVPGRGAIHPRAIAGTCPA